MAEHPTSAAALDSDAELEPDVDDEGSEVELESELGGAHAKDADGSGSSGPAPTTCSWNDCTRTCDSLSALVKVRAHSQLFCYSDAQFTLRDSVRPSLFLFRHLKYVPCRPVPSRAVPSRRLLLWGLGAPCRHPVASRWLHSIPRIKAFETNALSFGLVFAPSRRVALRCVAFRSTFEAARRASCGTSAIRNVLFCCAVQYCTSYAQISYHSLLLSDGEFSFGRTDGRELSSAQRSASQRVPLI